MAAHTQMGWVETIFDGREGLRRRADRTARAARMGLAIRSVRREVDRFFMVLGARVHLFAGQTDAHSEGAWPTWALCVTNS